MISLKYSQLNSFQRQQYKITAIAVAVFAEGKGCINSKPHFSFWKAYAAPTTMCFRSGHYVCLITAKHILKFHQCIAQTASQRTAPLSYYYYRSDGPGSVFALFTMPGGMWRLTKMTKDRPAHR